MRRREALTALTLAPGLAWRGAARGADGKGGDSAVLRDVLRGAGPVARQVLSGLTEFELQIRWTRCRRTRGGAWQIEAEHGLGLQPRRWFAAASFVKLPLAAVLGEALCQRGLVGQLGELLLHVDGAAACAPLPDAVAGGLPLLRLLRAMLVVSDNAAYNALYELIGSDPLHARLAALGYRSCRVGARLGCGAAVRPGKLAAQLSVAQAPVVWDSPSNPVELPQLFPYGAALKGRAWFENGRQIVGAHDFTQSNFMPLSDVHRMMMELGSGSAWGPGPAFKLCPAMRRLLADTMRMTPRECPDPDYDPTAFPDDHGKWLLPTDADGHLPARLRIANKNAQSYGYLGDSAFIVDEAHDLAFGLTAVLYVDRDGVLNDGRYAYAEIGRPFLRELGAAVWAYERSHRF